MSHKDAGNFRAKHQPDKKIEHKIAEAVRSKIVDGGIPCAIAATIAEQLCVPMATVGINLDLINVRITECQLGLFGYRTAKKIVVPAETFEPEWERAIRRRLINEHLPCVVAWEIADEFGIPRMEVSSICEAMKIKIKPCQLGAF
jgi:hypothetical protein